MTIALYIEAIWASMCCIHSAATMFTMEEVDFLVYPAVSNIKVQLSLSSFLEESPTRQTN